MGGVTESRQTRSLVFLLYLALTALDSQIPVPPRFSASVGLVPIDVRVVDDDGKSVSDLKASDFSIYDNAQKQEVSHFQQTVEGGESASVRTFAIVLGRGRLNQPGRALDALIDFARRRMLPNDRLCVIAYLRATELTTNHEAVARWLERYRDRHEDIESRLVRDNARVFGPELALSADTRSRIDGLFEGPSKLPYHQLPGGVHGRSLIFSDSRYLVRAIQYLGEVDGEKHVLFLSEQGLPIGRSAIDDPAAGYYARLASTARVALALIYTGGMQESTLRQGRLAIRRTLSRSSSILMGSDYRSVAEQTGGLASLFEDVSKPLAQLDLTTRSQYLLGYYPSIPTAIDGYRRIRVVVNRPGVRVLYRHIYNPKTRLDEGDLERVFAEERVEQVLSWLGTSSGRGLASRMRVTGTVASTVDGEQPVKIELAFDASRTRFIKNGDAFVAAPFVVVVVDGIRGEPLAKVSERLSIRLTEHEYSRLQAEWLKRVVTVRVKGDPLVVRAVVFDYDTDQVLYDSANLRKKPPADR